MLDTISGFLMFSVAVGMVAAILIAVSRVAEAWVPLERAFVAPAIACAIGAGLVNVWGSVRGTTGISALAILLFLIGLFQAEWAFAMTRPTMRRAAVPAGIVISLVAVVVGLIWALGAPGASTDEPPAATDVVGIGLGIGVLVLLVMLLRSRPREPGRVQRIAARTAVEIRSLAVAVVTLLTFLAVAGPTHTHA